MFTVSKRVEEGTLVKKRGTKLIRYTGRGKLMGVWTNGFTRVTITLDGERIVTEVPAGVIITGSALAKLGSQRC